MLILQCFPVVNCCGCVCRYDAASLRRFCSVSGYGWDYPDSVFRDVPLCYPEFLFNRLLTMIVCSERFRLSPLGEIFWLFSAHGSSTTPVKHTPNQSYWSSYQIRAYCIYSFKYVFFFWVRFYLIHIWFWFDLFMIQIQIIKWIKLNFANQSVYNIVQSAGHHHNIHSNFIYENIVQESFSPRNVC